MKKFRKFKDCIFSNSKKQIAAGFTCEYIDNKENKSSQIYINNKSEIDNNSYI